jgi:creatinine amidohydrolase/Fe(II)-dependent formamide hydrolase-like protein
VVPVGSFEQHGDHLPLITDTVVAATIAARLAETYNLFLLPQSPSPAPTNTKPSPTPSASAPRP